jgi:hypothetical protein
VHDCLVWCALAFAFGLGIGGFVVNEVVWRKQRRELGRLRRDLDDHCQKWDGEMAELKRAMPRVRPE